MSARRKGSADAFGYTPRELRRAMDAMRGLQRGRVPVTAYGDQEAAERGAAILDALEEKQARREARAT